MKPLVPISASLSANRRDRWRLGLFAALAVLCFLILAGQFAFRKFAANAERARAAENHYRKAVLAWRENRLDVASAALDRAAELGFSRSEVNRLWGLVLARAGRGREAEPLLRAAWDEAAGRRADPEVADALARIAMGRFELGLALEVLDRWAREDPQNPQPLLWRAEIDRRTGGERDVRLGHFQEALDRDPNCDAALLGLAELHLMMGEHTKAAAAYSTYTKRVPQDVAGHIGLGMSALALNDMPLSVTELDRALRLDPNHTLALKERAAIDLDQGRAEVAIGRLDRAVAVDPFDPELRYQRSLVQARLGRRDLASADRRRWEELRREHARIKVLQQALIANPRDIPARAQAARWMVEHGRVEEGIAWARMVLEDQPDQPEANRLLADYHQSRGEFGLANNYRLHAEPGPSGAGAAKHNPAAPTQ